MPWSVVSLALLGGCWVTDREIDGKIGDEGVDSGDDSPITVTSVDPPWGTAAGGTEVTLAATPVGEGVIVRFGDANAAILSVDDGEVVVRTPPGAPGEVDVEVQWGAHQGATSKAFEYFVDGSDSYGAVGTLGWVDVVGWLAVLGYADSGRAWVNFTERSPYGYDAFYGTSLDTCASGWTFPGTIVEASDGTAVHLDREAGRGLTLAWDSEDDAYVTELVAEGTGNNGWVSNGVFDLGRIEGVVDYPPISTKGFARTPSVFSVQTTCDLCGGPSNLDAFTPPTVFQDDFQVRWNASNPGDYVLIRVDVYADDESSSPTEQVRCLVHDDGAFTIPEAAFTTSFGVSPVDLWVGRALASTAVLPHDNSKSGVAGVYWVVGAATIYPPQ